jgi:hypothetical protein
MQIRRKSRSFLRCHRPRVDATESDRKRMSPEPSRGCRIATGLHLRSIAAKAWPHTEPAAAAAPRPIHQMPTPRSACLRSSRVQKTDVLRTRCRLDRYSGRCERHRSFGGHSKQSFFASLETGFLPTLQPVNGDYSLYSQAPATLPTTISTKPTMHPMTRRRLGNNPNGIWPRVGSAYPTTQ